MPRGRKATPQALKILKSGHTNAAPDAPAYLDTSARAEWNRIVPELLARGVLDRVDRAALALYCRCFSRWQKANKLLDAKGLVSETAAGGDKLHPAAMVAAQCEAQMTRLLKQFGATPAGRKQVPGSGQTAKDELSEFLGQRKA